MFHSLKEKRIGIIGGTSGIGLSIANVLLQNGAKVTVLGLPDEQQEYASDLQVIYGDAREESMAEKVIEACKGANGGMDGLVHVAGGSGRKWGDGPLHEITLKGWEETIKLNLTTVFQSNRAAVQHFLKEGQGGSIVNISSVLATHPAPHFFATHAYASAKSAIIGFSKSIAAYYCEQNIRVNVIAPALTDTPMAKRATGRADIQAYIKTKQPLDGGRVARADDIHGAACYFLSDESRFTTGQVLSVDGGWSVSEGQFSDIKVE